MYTQTTTKLHLSLKFAKARALARFWKSHSLQAVVYFNFVSRKCCRRKAYLNYYIFGATLDAYTHTYINNFNFQLFNVFRYRQAIFIEIQHIFIYLYKPVEEECL